MTYFRVSFNILIYLFLLSFLSCTETKELKELAELGLKPPQEQEIDRSQLGVNNFFVLREFGSINAQYRDIRDTLKVPHIRVLFAWTNPVQPTPDSQPNYSFFDAIVNSVPPSTDLLVVVAHTPDWMGNPANWIDGDPRKTWVERWLRPTVSRYAGRPNIVGWEIWNEPDLTVLASDAALGLTEPENYMSMLRMGVSVVRSIDPTSLILQAATQSIQQSYPTNLRYNQRLVELGAPDLVDIWNIHYYSTQYENVIRRGGIAEFLNGLGKRIWVTESGQKDPNAQLSYVNTTWPFLREQIPSIERIYYYEYGSIDPLEENFGLRTNNSEFPVSDFYIHLRDNAP